ncbi:uncharacterized protein LOC107819885 [Nicotiana tabacum]|uniref:Uncharacterized protein LOC107819885 n=5 Tax=Nicotiana tabacum TaxID=4097 RepID=A0AC58SB42_TOBAC
MTLEDFFTLTEMSNGLTAPARVQELVSIMQKEKERGVKNTIEIMRHWTAVASTIAATENKECLELFIQLDGLHFTNSWLKDAQELGSDTSDNVAEETITHFLRAIERLHVDKEKSVSSGIMMTVKNLLGHKSSKIQERSKVLFDSWEKETDEDAVSVGEEKVQASIDDKTRVITNVVGEVVNSEPSLGGVSPSGSREEKSEEHINENKLLSSRSGDIHPSIVNYTEALDRNLQHTMLEDGSPNSPSLAKSASEDEEKYLTYHAESSATAIDTSTSAVERHCSLDKQKDIPVSESVNCLNHVQEVGSPEKLDSAVPKPLDNKTFSSGPDAREDSEAVSGQDLQRQNDAKNVDDGKEIFSVDNVSVASSKGKIPKNSVFATHDRGNTVLGAKKERKYDIDILQDSPNKHNVEHPKDLSIALMKVDVGGDEKCVSNKSEDDLETDTEFEVPQRGITICNVLEKKGDIELDYGIIDPLEVARQVAIEVEREVQESCSSSEKTRESKVHEPDSPDSRSANGSNEEIPKGMPVRPEVSLAYSEAGPINVTEKLESSQITDAALDLESNDQKGCDFDLNLEVSSDDIDRPGNPISTSISVVSASRAAAAPGVPVPPLQFEGTLGWKGSAATSAFRPASPRKIPESDKAVSSGGSDSISKQQQSCLDIDLNVAEGGDDRLADLITGKQASVSSTLPSGESSVEASPKKLARLELDLNCASEEGEAPTNWRVERRLFPDRGDWSHSPSSSSSSKQPSLRNFDLNDQPTFLHDSSDLPFFKKPSQYTNTSGAINSGDSVVSIMGMKVDVNHKDPVSRSVMLPNGRIVENAVDLSTARSGFLGMGSPFPYTHSPATGYNGITPAPAMPFPSAMYGSGGSVPYMVDSRGAPFVPHILGSASAIPPSFYHQPFVISMTGAPVSSGVMPPRRSLDLNTGSILEGGTRNHRGTMQLFDQGPTRSMDDHFRTTSGPSTSSSIGGKRKEPDDGWEPFPFKLHPPPWK